MNQVVEADRALREEATGSPRGLTLLRTYLLIGVSLPFLHGLASQIGPNDYWWHLAYGRDIVQTWGIPRIDTYSFVRSGEPFFDQGWFAQLAMYGVHSLGGVRLAVLALALVLVATYTLLLRETYVRTRSIKLSVIVVTAFTGLLSATNWSMRPQTFAFLIFTAMYVRVEGFRRGDVHPHKLWSVPVLMVVWVNVHGSFVVGIAYLGLVLAGEWWEQRRGSDNEKAKRLRALAVLTATTSAALLINPRGVDVFRYVTGLVGDTGVRDLVTEWQPPTLATTAGALFLLGVLGVFLTIAYSPRRLSTTELLLCGAFLLLGLTAVRNSAWFAIVVTPMVAQQLSALAPLSRPDERGWAWGNRVIVAALLLLAVITWPWNRPLVGPGPFGGVVTSDTPLRGVPALQSGPTPTRLLNELGFGAYLMFAAPEQDLFIDPRIEFYPYELLQDYMILSAGYDVPRLVDKYDFDAALLSKRIQPQLVDALRVDPAWSVDYEDSTAVFLRRDS